MNYTCFVEEKQVYVHEISEEEEDKIDFLLAAEAAFEELDKKNNRNYPEGTLSIRVVSDLGTSRVCEVVKAMKPRYTASSKEPVYQDEDI